MNKDRLIDYILGIIVLMVIPQIAFFALNSITPLNPIIYVIASLGGFYFICFSLTILVMKEKMKLMLKSLYIFILMIILPILGYYAFDFVSLVPLNTTYFAEAGFSFVFSLCVVVGFKLIMPKEKYNVNNHHLKRWIVDLGRGMVVKSNKSGTWNYNNILKFILFVSGVVLILFVTKIYGCVDLKSSTFLIISSGTLSLISLLIISSLFKDIFKEFIIKWIFGNYEGNRNNYHSKFIDIMRTLFSSFIFGMSIIVAITSSNLAGIALWGDFHTKVIFFLCFFAYTFIVLFATIGYEMKS
jgi:hypothetical protein